MKIKQFLLAVLGEKRYLSLLSNAFQLLYRTGRLGKDYQDIYFLKRFIRKGDTCIDIGAHLGYYTLELGRLVGPEGKVYAVEPMSKFNSVLKRVLARYRVRNVTVYPVALGGDGQYVEMGIPAIDRKKRFAYARVMESSPGLEYAESEIVENRRGDQLFAGIGRLDFVKCDVEGLEFAVFSSMMQTLTDYHPILLIEIIDREHRIRLHELLNPLGYTAFALDRGKWRAIDVYDKAPVVSQNNYFIAAEARRRLDHLFFLAP
ncbi:MAG TPA: FkbM family methyltransferase [Puia sp.]|nr:FkbM family methyltransferase [Puia sp.]